jgi:hypothetical protein
MSQDQNERLVKIISYIVIFTGLIIVSPLPIILWAWYFNHWSVDTITTIIIYAILYGFSIYLILTTPTDSGGSL